VVHLRIVAPSHAAEHALDLLKATPSACNLIFLQSAAHKPEGDVILCDVAREDASVIVSDLKEFGIEREGSIAIEHIDSLISEGAEPSENTELSASYLLFMVLACLIASVGILLDSPILIIGAMVVGPEFGPLAGLCVAIVQRRPRLIRRSLLPLIIGFPIGITAAFLFTLAIDGVGLTPEGFSTSVHPNTDFISDPDAFSFMVAAFAGTAGVLSLTNAKSGALVGVLISVTTIPAAANIGLAAAHEDVDEWLGAMGQLAANLTMICLAGIVTLFVQRKLYQRRRVSHLRDEARQAGGLPIGESRRAMELEKQRTKVGASGGR
jgi:uncharacterized hydrophobic protein (TIGR00271 family)